MNLGAMALTSFGPTNVTLNLSSSLQPDSIGYNLPKELPGIIYTKIIDGSVALWDGPAKEIQISADALQAIEKSSGTIFTSVDNLFIHEVWELSRRYLDSKTIGFTFINKNEKGSVAYGFVDYKDIVELLNKVNIPTNANGYLNTSFREAIQNKQFNFSIIQFGADDFKAHPNRAFEIQKQLFNNPKVKMFNEPKEKARFKTITYELARTGNNQNEAVFSALNSYFENNLEQFYNLGGDQLVSFYKKNPEINFTKIKVSELYKLDKGVVTFEISAIHLFIYGKHLAESDIGTMRQIGVTVNFKPLETFISEKNYDMVITQINSEEIKSADSAAILLKLKEGNWKSLIVHE